MRQTLGPLMRLEYRAGEKKKADRGKELAPRCDMTRSKNLMLDIAAPRNPHAISGVSRCGRERRELHLQSRGRRASHSKPMRCDHCRKSFGLILHRHFRLRFCTADCLTAYQRHLDDSRYLSVHSPLRAHAAAASSNREPV